MRYSPWYGSGGSYLLSAPPKAWVTDPDFLRRAIGEGRSLGIDRFLIQANSATQRSVLVASGYLQVDELHVLFRRTNRDLPRLPESAHGARLSRATSIHLEEVIRIDNLCFDPFWAMNQLALTEALAATPRTRFRVLTEGDQDRVIGYAIFGLGGGEGYLQRIAVDPGWQRRGLATRLISDGLRWARRWRARRVGVNTQKKNQGALRLYLELGFELQEEGIAIFQSPEL